MKVTNCFVLCVQVALSAATFAAGQKAVCSSGVDKNFLVRQATSFET